MQNIYDLITFDLNLLVVLDLLLETRSVSETARRLGRTQSAISHALGRLRDLFGDPLLVRTGNTMAPTPLAVDLQTPTRRATQKARAVFDRRPFDPTTLERRMTVSMSDYAATVLIPPLLQRLTKSAPGLDVELVTLGDDSEQAARDGAIALGVGAFHQHVDGIKRRVLFDEVFACAGRVGHPALVGGELDLDGFTASDHVLVSPRGRPGGVVDARLAALGRRRRVRLITRSFLAALHAAADTDMLVTAPLRLLHVVSRRMTLEIVPAPIPLPCFSVTMIFGDIYAADPAHRFLRSQVMAIAADLAQR